MGAMDCLGIGYGLGSSIQDVASEPHARRQVFEKDLLVYVDNTHSMMCCTQYEEY